MYKISYPSTAIEIDNLKANYYNCLKNNNKNNISGIDVHLANIIQSPNLTFEKLVKMDFAELNNVIPFIESYNSKLKRRKIGKGKKTKLGPTDFEKLFDYRSNQGAMAAFFMNQTCFRLKACFYCGIDYVTVFKDLDDDYKNEYQFINNATERDLMIVPSIGEKRAKAIIKKRNIKKFTSVKDIGNFPRAWKFISSFNFQNSHNHFTLDHIYPQKTHRFLALCLYNLVPCCAPCNMKFKKDFPFQTLFIDKLSPTSVNFSIYKDVEFKILFDGQLKNIKSVDNFWLSKEIKSGNNYVENYFSLFKLMGRYIAHKDKLLPIISNKINYPESRLKQLSRQTGISISKLREIIFGKELFDSTEAGTPLLKLKRDIARNINVKNVLPL